LVPVPVANSAKMSQHYAALSRCFVWSLLVCER